MDDFSESLGEALSIVNILATGFEKVIKEFSSNSCLVVVPRFARIDVALEPLHQILDRFGCRQISPSRCLITTNTKKLWITQISKGGRYSYRDVIALHCDREVSVFKRRRGLGHQKGFHS